MAYSTDLIKITWGGSLYQGKDIWSNGIHGLAPEDAIENFATKAAALGSGAVLSLTDWMSDADTFISSAAVLEWVKVALIGTDGKYLTDSVTYDITPTPGTQGSIVVPPQISTVVSLTTDFNRGLAHIGRIYPPLSGYPEASGYINSTVVQLMTEASVRLINNLENDYQSGFGPAGGLVIASKVGTGVSRLITGVRVGNVLDTQRSRRNAFTETYTSLPL